LQRILSFTSACVTWQCEEGFEEVVGCGQVQLREQLHAKHVKCSLAAAAAAAAAAASNT
jgi:hypothetical protein